MKPEEKAKELYDKFTDAIGLPVASKQCALICCDEILKANPTVEVKKSGSDNRGDWSHLEFYSNTDFWNEVKTQILNL